MAKQHELIGFAVLVTSAVYVAAHYSELPARVVTHVNGAADRFGLAPRQLVFAPVGIAFWLYVLLSIPLLVQASGSEPGTHPEIWHAAERMLSWVKLELMWLLGYFSWITVRSGLGESIQEWRIYAAVLIAILGITIVVGLMKLKRVAASSGGEPSQKSVQESRP